MSTAAASARGASTSVVGAAVATGFGILPLVGGFSQASLPTGALFGAGWPAFGFAAALLLDRGVEHRVGRALAALALVPAVMAVLAMPAGPDRFWDRLEELWSSAVVAVVLLTLALLAGATGYAPGRTPRRRLFWLLLWSGLVLGAVLVAEAALDARAEAAVVTLGMWSLAGLVTRLTLAGELRPVDEPFLDVAAWRSSSRSVRASGWRCAWPVRGRACRLPTSPRRSPPWPPRRLPGRRPRGGDGRGSPAGTARGP